MNREVSEGADPGTSEPEGPFEFRRRSELPASNPTETRERPEGAPATDRGPGDRSGDLGGVPPRSTTPRVGRALWLVLAASMVALVIAVLAWRDADGDPDRGRASARDQAVIQGTRAVETMNTMDHRAVDEGVQAWQRVATGVLRDQLATIDAEQRKLLAEQGKIATGRVVQAALTDLDDRSATLLAAVEITVRDSEDDTEPAIKRNRFSATLAKVGEVWKVEDLQQVAVAR